MIFNIKFKNFFQNLKVVTLNLKVVTLNLKVVTLNLKVVTLSLKSPHDINIFLLSKQVYKQDNKQVYKQVLSIGQKNFFVENFFYSDIDSIKNLNPVIRLPIFKSLYFTLKFVLSFISSMDLLRIFLLKIFTFIYSLSAIPKYERSSSKDMSNSPLKL